LGLFKNFNTFNPDPKFFAMQVANAVIPSGFAETASEIWVNAARSPDGPSGLGLTGVHGQKISDPGFKYLWSGSLWSPSYFAGS
jgi:hypothetical protein